MIVCCFHTQNKNLKIMNFQTKKKESSTSQKKQTEARNNVKCHYQ